MAEIHHIEEQSRLAPGRAVMGVLDAWGIDARHRPALLGLPDNTCARRLNQYRRAATPLPDDETVLLRVHYILTIHDAVETMHPRNPHCGHYWVTTRNRFFTDNTPLEVMLEGGVEGMRRLVDHLNGTGEWI